jgi:hypothetical protein
VIAAADTLATAEELFVAVFSVLFVQRQNDCAGDSQQQL